MTWKTAHRQKDIRAMEVGDWYYNVRTAKVARIAKDEEGNDSPQKHRGHGEETEHCPRRTRRDTKENEGKQMTPKAGTMESCSIH